MKGVLEIEKNDLLLRICSISHVKHGEEAPLGGELVDVFSFSFNHSYKTIQQHDCVFYGPQTFMVNIHE